MKSLAETPITALKGVGPKQAEKLATLRLHSVQDMLFHLPLRYEDRSRVYPIAGLLPGQRGFIVGEIEQPPQVNFGRRRSLLLRIADGSGSATLRFFHFSAAQKNGFVVGARIACFGELRRGPSGTEMVHPEYKLLGPTELPNTEAGLTAVYPATDGLQQRSIRRLSKEALKTLRQNPLLLPDYLQQADALGNWPTLQEALEFTHCPPVSISLAELQERSHSSQQRLAFEELLAHTLSLQQLRLRTRRVPAPSLSGGEKLFERLLEQLGFALTGAQQRVIAELQDDLLKTQPALRLVQGDVGAGKKQS